MIPVISTDGKRLAANTNAELSYFCRKRLPEVYVPTHFLMVPLKASLVEKAILKGARLVDPTIIDKMLAENNASKKRGAEAPLASDGVYMKKESISSDQNQARPSLLEVRAS